MLGCVWHITITWIWKSTWSRGWFKRGRYWQINSKFKLSLQNSYADYWRNEIRNINKHPILRTYSLFKTVHVSESYLSINMDINKICIARFRVSSHRLGIETGWHKKNTNICRQQSLCLLPGTITRWWIASHHTVPISSYWTHKIVWYG